MAGAILDSDPNLIQLIIAYIPYDIFARPPDHWWHDQATAIIRAQQYPLPRVSAALARLCPASIDWNRLTDRELPDDFIIEHSSDLNIHRMIILNKLSEAVLDHISDRDFIIAVSYISRRPHLSEAFMIRHARKLNWFIITSEQPLTEAFMTENERWILWSQVAWSQLKISENFISDNIYRLNLDAIIIKRKLSPEFISQHIGLIHWKDWTYTQPQMTDEFRREHQHRALSPEIPQTHYWM
jgi:hypothetical protein